MASVLSAVCCSDRNRAHLKKMLLNSTLVEVRCLRESPGKRQCHRLSAMLQPSTGIDGVLSSMLLTAACDPLIFESTSRLAIARRHRLSLATAEQRRNQANPVARHGATLAEYEYIIRVYTSRQHTARTHTVPNRRQTASNFGSAIGLAIIVR